MCKAKLSFVFFAKVTQDSRIPAGKTCPKQKRMSSKRIGLFWLPLIAPGVIQISLRQVKQICSINVPSKLWLNSLHHTHSSFSHASVNFTPNSWTVSIYTYEENHFLLEQKVPRKRKSNSHFSFVVAPGFTEVRLFTGISEPRYKKPHPKSPIN